MRSTNFAILVAFMTFLFTALAFIFVEVVDPYCENSLNPRLAKCLQLGPYSVQRQLEHLKERPAHVVFGTSRSMLINPLVVKEPVINFTTVYGNPSDVLRFLNELQPEHWEHISQVTYLLDLHVFTAMNRFDRNFLDSSQALRAKFERFGLEPVRLALRQVALNLTGYPKSEMYMDERGYQVRPLTPSHHFTGTGNDTAPTVTVDANELSALGQVDALFKNHKVHVQYVTPTFPIPILKQLDWEKLRRLRHAILDQVGPYSEMTYVQGLSDDNKSFSDATHLDQAGMIELYSSESVLKYRVDHHDIDAVLTNMRNKVR